MPILSMFYGIVIRMYFWTTSSIMCLTCTPNRLDSGPCSASTMGRYWLANCHPARRDWCRHGSRFGAKNCSLIGNWP